MDSTRQKTKLETQPQRLIYHDNLNQLFSSTYYLVKIRNLEKTKINEQTGCIDILEKSPRSATPK